MDADKWTDKELLRLEKRIRNEYEKASKEAGKKAQEYFSQYVERYERERLAYLTSFMDKEYVKQEWIRNYGNDMMFESWYKQANHAYGINKQTATYNFNRWQISQMGRGKRYEDLADQLAKRMTESALIAQGYINSVLPSVYVANYNYMAEIAERSAISQGYTGIKFDLIDEYTVRNLMVESSSVRPYKKINISIDEYSNYSKNKLQDELLQGVLLGESPYKIADRFEKVVGMRRSEAIRNARTAITNAQNAGKQDRFNDLASKGVIAQKKWVATNDDRTRPEHREVNGQIVDRNEPFEVGGEELMYPADPSASGWNRYNCRCTMKLCNIKFKSIMTDKQRAKANIRVL